MVEKERIKLSKEKAALIRDGKDLSPMQILDRVSEIEGVKPLEVRKYHPRAEGSAGADFHTHQFADIEKDGRLVFGETQAKRFWDRVAETELEDIAVIPHSNILSPESNADAIYDTLSQHKPPHLSGKRLWKGMEVKTYSNLRDSKRDRIYTGEIAILALDPSQRLDPFFYEKHTLTQMLDKLGSDPNLVGFVTHPNAPDGIATGLAREEEARLVAEDGLSKKNAKARVAESRFGEQRAATLMQEHSLGTEYHGFYKETLDTAKTGHVYFSSAPLIGGAIGRLSGKAVSIVERMYDVSMYEGAADFMVVGSDAHKTEHIGDSYLIVEAPEQMIGEGMPLGDVYDVSELDSGLVVLTAKEMLRNRSLIDAIRDSSVEKTYVLSEPPEEKTFGEFKTRLARLISERKAQLKEGAVTKRGAEMRGKEETMAVSGRKYTPFGQELGRSIDHLMPTQLETKNRIINGILCVDGVTDPTDLRVLDVGCGTGNLVYALQNEGVTTYGVDRERECVIKGREKGVENLRTGNVHELPYEDGFFDIVHASALFELSMDAEAAGELSRMVRPGGLLVTSTDNFEEHKRLLESQGLRFEEDLSRRNEKSGYLVLRKEVMQQQH